MRRKLLGPILAIAIALAATPAEGGQTPLPLANPACGAKIVSSFRLSGDRTCAGDGWHVNKAGLTIDLNGFHLRGARAANTTGILLQEAITLDPADDVTIRNGTVRGFDIGIDVGSTVRNTVIQDVALVDHVDTAVSIVGSKTTVRNSTVAANDEDGIVVNGGAKDANVVKNRVGNNVRYGVFVISDENVVAKNTVASNGAAGIRVSGDDNVIGSNVVSGNGHVAAGDPGIVVFGDRNTSTRNVIVGSGDDGYQDQGARNRAERNKAYGNGFLQGAGSGVGTGIDVSAATEPKGGGNRALGNDAPTSCTKASMCTSPKGDKDLPKRTPVCGETVTKSFRLGSDMTCSGHGLVVGAPNITIDLGGRTIRGDGGAADRGIVNDSNLPNSGHDGVEIRNGVVRRFDIGVRINGADDNVVAGVISLDNAGGSGFSAHGDGHEFKKDIAVANGLGGFNVFSTNTVVKLLHASNNQTAGIFVNGLAGPTIVDRSISTQNSGIGIAMSADNSTVRRSIVAGNGVEAGYAGIDASAIGTDVTANTVFANGGDGYVDFGGGPTIIDNRMDGNGYVLGASNESGLGIDASVALPEGADNTARGNDDARECDPESFCP